MDADGFVRITDFGLCKEGSTSANKCIYMICVYIDIDIYLIYIYS